MMDVLWGFSTMRVAFVSRDLAESMSPVVWVVRYGLSASYDWVDEGGPFRLDHVTCYHRFPRGAISLPHRITS